MRLRDFRSGWRVLARQPLHTATMLLGLAIGLAAAFLLLAFVHYSFSYDSTVPDNRNVHVVKHRLHLLAQPHWIEQMPLPARDVLARSGLPVTLCTAIPHREMVKADGEVREMTFTEVSATFPAMFGVDAAAGDLAAALARPDGLALTPRGARHLFGTAGALGRTVDVNGRVLRVLALLPEPPSNTTLPYTALVGEGTVLWAPGEREKARHNWMALAGKLYAHAPGVKPEALAAPLRQEANRVVAATVGADAMRRAGGKMVEVAVTPLSEAYFDTDVAVFHGGERASKPRVLALAALAFLILALAGTNYVNLATVGVLARGREIAVRKTLGAGTGRLAAQFVAESVAVALGATALGMLLAWLLLPLFSELMGRPLDAFLSPSSLLVALVLGLAVGLACGIWPARMALRVLPAQALAGRAGSEPAGNAWLRRILTVFQFTAAIALCALALAIGWQARFAAQADPGLALDDFVLLHLRDGATVDSRQSFFAALERVPGVQGIAAIDLPFGHAMVRSSTAFRGPAGVERRVEMSLVSPSFFAVTGIAPMAGGAFDAARPAAVQKGDVMLNEAAARALGFASGAAAVGQVVAMGASVPLRVIGIVPPLRHKGLRQPPQAMVYMVEQGNANVVMVRAGLDAEDLQKAVAPLLRRYFPGPPVWVQRARAVFEDGSADDRRIASLLTLGALVATGIAASGIYVLAAGSMRRRGREIALRKLHGAGGGAIALLVGTEFALLLLAAAMLALPPAGLAIARYLAGFSAATQQAWWALPGALLVGALTVFGATLRHALAAMRMAPATVLRQED
ncbi:ABC transporter permease [Massilia sp. METH4]|uniref:ABC transporter permease n=1 Tax=Massilia sp. METH4 TaxID=3123041 RepID=UPI0030CB708F